MEQIAFVTGADRGLGQALVARLLEKGWRVIAGQYMPEWPELAALKARYPEMLDMVPLDVTDQESVQQAARLTGELVPHIDLLINDAGISCNSNSRDLREGQDYADIKAMHEVNALGPLRVVEAFLPLTDRSELKRLCFVSSEAGSVNNAQRTAWYGYCMSKAALNMGVRILFNQLRPDGYSFRIYHPGWVRGYLRGSKNTQADLEPEEAAIPAIAYFLRPRANERPTRSDEERLVLRDWLGREWPW